MTGYGQFCSMARAHEVLGGRWTLLIVREILCGSRRFNVSNSPITLFRWLDFFVVERERESPS